MCSGRQKQTFDKGTHNVCHGSSVSVFNTDCNGIWHISKTSGVRERWIFVVESIHWRATVPTTITVVLKKQVPNNLNSKQKTRKRHPIKRWESGLFFRLYIAPVSANHRLYDTYNVYRRRLERVNTQEPSRLQFKWWIYSTMTTTKIIQGNADGDKKRSREDARRTLRRRH